MSGTGIGETVTSYRGFRTLNGYVIWIIEGIHGVQISGRQRLNVYDRIDFTTDNFHCCGNSFL